jgi:hypothetical protein
LVDVQKLPELPTTFALNKDWNFKAISIPRKSDFQRTSRGTRKKDSSVDE